MVVGLEGGREERGFFGGGQGTARIWRAVCYNFCPIFGLHMNIIFIIDRFKVEYIWS